MVVNQKANKRRTDSLSNYFCVRIWSDRMDFTPVRRLDVVGRSEVSLRLEEERVLTLAVAETLVWLLPKK